MLTRSAAFSMAPPALASRWFVLFENQVGPYSNVVETVEATFINTEAKARYSQGSNNYFAETTDIEGLNIMFYEDEKFSVTKWLKDWRKQVYNPENGVYGYPDDYKKRIYIELFSYEENRPILTLGYKNCWPTTAGTLALSYEDPNGRLQVTQQFSVDTLEFE